jgi:nicotinate phosphoribosyltransferase
VHGQRTSQGFGDDDLAAFASLRFMGDVWAVPEGRVVFAEVGRRIP